MKSRIRELAIAAILLFGATAGVRAGHDSTALEVGVAFRLFVQKPLLP
jgi:hypothetical protein